MFDMMVRDIAAPTHFFVAREPVKTIEKSVGSGHTSGLDDWRRL